MAPDAVPADSASDDDASADPPDSPDADATYWGRYKGRWRQCFVVMFVLGFIVIVVERIGEVHNATNAAALTLNAVVGGVGDGLLLGSVICLLVAIPRRHTPPRATV